MFPMVLALALAAPEPASYDALVQQAQQAWGVPGVVVAVVRADEVLYLQGHGPRGPGLREPMTPQTLFPISSCTKGFTVALLAQLVDAGKIDWDDPVRKHVAEFRLGDAMADREVKLRDLLCHRTGLAGHQWLWYRAPWTRAELIRRVGLLPLDKPFRSAFQYQNTMFVVAGQAAENASGQAWEKLLREKLLTPLGMTQTFSHGVNLPDGRLARGHRQTTDGLTPVPLYLVDQPDPALSMVSCANDLAKWLQFQLRLGQVDGKPLIQKETMEALRKPQIALPLEGVEREVHSETTQMGYGLGWVVQDYRGRPLASHAGVLDGMRVHLTLAPRDGVGIVILANVERTRMNVALSNMLLDHVLKLEKRDWHRSTQAALKRAEPRVEKEDPPGVGGPGVLEDYVGRYDHPAYGTVRVTRQGDRLRWSFNRFAGPLEAVRGTTFRLREPTLDDPLAHFHRAERGTIGRLEMLGSFGVTFRRVAE